MNNFQVFIFVLLLALDLLFTAIRASLLNVRFPRLASMLESGVKNIERTIELVTRRARTRSSLKLGQGLAN